MILRSQADRSRRRSAKRQDAGSVTAFTVIVFVTLLGFAGLVVDGGLALTARVQALGQAEDAARAGAQAVDMGILRLDHAVVLNPAEAQQDARAYLSGVGAEGTVRADTQHVTVTVTVRTPTHLLTLFGIDSLTEQGSATAHAATGTAQP